MKYIFGNWKSNKNLNGALEWLKDFGKVNTDNEIILLPAFNLLGAIYNQALEAGFVMGVQDLSSMAAGSYTGAVSAVNLEGMEVKYAILGHSERRHHFGETDQDVANKVERALEAGLVPVVCVDEDYIFSQAAALEQSQLSKCMVAYEPLSAIGTGEEMSVKKVEEVFAQIKKVFGEVKVIYGGSVNPNNVDEYLLVGDGVLVGTASLDAKEFLALSK